MCKEHFVAIAALLCCGTHLHNSDQQPFENWARPIFHSLALTGDDGEPNVCHRGPGIPSVVNTNEFDDLGLGVEGEVSRAQ